MRKRGLALISAITAISFCFILVSSGLFNFTLAQYIPNANDHSVYEYAVNPPADIDYHYPLANYALVRNGNAVGVFESMGVASFEPGIDYETPQTTMTMSHTDQYSYLAVHETLTTVIEFKAIEDNALKFKLDAGTGAIRSGDAILIGNEDASGVIVFDEDVVASIDGDDVLFDVPADSTVIFRADPSWDRTVGSAVAGGRVAAEMYLTDEGGYLVEDIVSFDDVGLEAVSASKNEVKVSISGTPGTEKAIVLHVNDVYLDYGSAEDISVQLDSKNIKVGEGMGETLWETGEDARYFVLKTVDGYDVVVYIPQYSDQIITIGSAERELGIDGMATMLAAIGIVGVAVLALIKKD